MNSPKTHPSCVRSASPTVDYLGLALALESASKKVESRTAQRAMEAGARGLRLALASATATNDHCSVRDELVRALQGVIRVADRDTDEFNFARAALAKAGAA